jgi:hypothetical protein
MTLEFTWVRSESCSSNQSLHTETIAIFPPLFYPKPTHVGFVVANVSLVPGLLCLLTLLLVTSHSIIVPC